MASLSFQHVYKKYDGGVVAVSDFNLEVAPAAVSPRP